MTGSYSSLEDTSPFMVNIRRAISMATGLSLPNVRIAEQYGSLGDYNTEFCAVKVFFIEDASYPYSIERTVSKTSVTANAWLSIKGDNPFLFENNAAQNTLFSSTEQFQDLSNNTIIINFLNFPTTGENKTVSVVTGSNTDTIRGSVTYSNTNELTSEIQALLGGTFSVTYYDQALAIFGLNQASAPATILLNRTDSDTEYSLVFPPDDEISLTGLNTDVTISKTAEVSFQLDQMRLTGVSDGEITFTLTSAIDTRSFTVSNINIAGALSNVDSSTSMTSEETSALEIQRAVNNQGGSDNENPLGFSTRVSYNSQTSAYTIRPSSLASDVAVTIAENSNFGGVNLYTLIDSTTISASPAIISEPVKRHGGVHLISMTQNVEDFQDLSAGNLIFTHREANINNIYTLEDLDISDITNVSQVADIINNRLTDESCRIQEEVTSSKQITLELHFRRGGAQTSGFLLRNAMLSSSVTSFLTSVGIGVIDIAEVFNETKVLDARTEKWLVIHLTVNAIFSSKTSQVVAIDKISGVFGTNDGSLIERDLS